MPLKASKSLSPKKMKQKTLTRFMVSSSPPSSSPPPPVKKRQARAARQKHKITMFDSDESENMEQDSDVGAIKFEPEILDVSDDDDSPRRPTRSNKRRKRFHTETDPVESDGSLEDGIGIPTRWKGSRKRRTIVHSDDESQTRKRKFVKGARPPSPEESVMDEVDENHIIESRFRTRDKKTTFQKNLEKLKNLKGKKRSTINLESSESDSDTEQPESSVVRPFKGARPDRGEASGSSSGEESGDDNFIVEDDERGGLTTRLPVAFSMGTHQDLAHQFKIVFQLFVHMAVRPTAERRPFMKKMLEAEEYFSVPLQVLRRKLSGMKDSLVTSSVWRPEFKKPLEKYPNIQLVRMEFSVPQCDACHLGGRVSTLLARVSGEPYDKYDFEPESEDESSRSSDDDDDSHESSVKQFHLGRFCAARTLVFHEFSHWEHHLYKTLLREIDDVLDDNRGFVRIAFAGGAKPPKDMRDADKVMDWLDQRGLVDMEWQKIRQLMDRARNLEIGARRGNLDELDM